MMFRDIYIIIYIMPLYLSSFLLLKPEEKRSSGAVWGVKNSGRGGPKCICGLLSCSALEIAESRCAAQEWHLQHCCPLRRKQLVLGAWKQGSCLQWLCQELTWRGLGRFPSWHCAREGPVQADFELGRHHVEANVLFLHLKPAPTKVFLVPQLSGMICVLRVKSAFVWGMTCTGWRLSEASGLGWASPNNRDVAGLLDR